MDFTLYFLPQYQRKYNSSSIKSGGFELLLNLWQFQRIVRIMALTDIAEEC